MSDHEIVERDIERKIEAYKKNQKENDKKSLDEHTEEVVKQVLMFERMGMINNYQAQIYLSDLKRIYEEFLKGELFKEWRENVINFNDDILTSQERLLLSRLDEKKSSVNMVFWEKELRKRNNSSNSNGMKNDHDSMQREADKEKDHTREVIKQYE